MSALAALAVGLVATLLAALRLVGFAATGMLVVDRGRPPFLLVPLSTLAGAGTTGVLYAVLLRAGHLPLALASDGALTALALGLRGRDACRAMTALLGELRRALGESVPARIVALVIAALYWLQAATPPRDTDSLRYHLAHIRQIDSEGVWAMLPIVHYAFPFSWQMAYLPFVHWRVAEAAQLLDAGVAIILIAAVASWLQRGTMRVMGTTALLFLVAFLLQPLILATATNASADEISMLAVGVTALLLVTADRASAADLRALGFAAWVGMSSRYQAAAIGVAASVVVATWCASGRAPMRALAGFVQGAFVGLVLAAPWYLDNWLAFGNPVWPLFASAAGASYADHVGFAFRDTWSGGHSAFSLLRAVAALVTDPLSFPIPLLVAGAAILVARRRGAGGAGGALGALALFTLVDLAVWAIAQPMLYARFIVYLAPIALIAWLRWSAEESSMTRLLRLATRMALVVSIAVFAAYDVASAAGPAFYLATGAAGGLQRFIWYYPVYEWINANAAPDARFLVIVGSAETYHLDRYYRRADPATSAVIDWPSIPDARALLDRLRQDRYDYVIYEAADWSASPGGTRMTRVLDSARASGLLETVTTFDLELTRSRFRRRVFPTTVVVLRVPTPARAGSAP